MMAGGMASSTGLRVVESVLDPEGVVAGLRGWAAGFPADEAAVELLACVAADHPQMLDMHPAWDPWLLPCPRPGWLYLDGAVLAEQLEVLPAQLRPVLTVMAGLVADGALIDLGVTLAGLPVEWRLPVFTALGHAAGCAGLQLVATDPDNDDDGLFPTARANPASTAGVPLGGDAA